MAKQELSPPLKDFIDFRNLSVINWKFFQMVFWLQTFLKNLCERLFQREFFCQLNVRWNWNERSLKLKFFLVRSKSLLALVCFGQKGILSKMLSLDHKSRFAPNIFFGRSALLYLSINLKCFIFHSLIKNILLSLE